MKYKRYQKYKDSGIEWIGEIPEHWEVKKIKRDTPIMRGASPRPIDDQRFFDDEGEYAWVRISDVTRSNGKLQKTTQRLSDEGSSLSVKLHPGELFLSIAGSVGKPCITDIKCCIHDGFVYFPKLTINKKVLYYIFEAGKCYGGLGKLGTQLNLNTETVGNIKIPIPPKNERGNIEQFLEKQTTQFDSLISKSQLQIKLLQEKRQALINHAVTKGLDPTVPMKDSGIEWIGEIPEHWEIMRLKFLCNITTGEKNTEDNELEGKFPFFVRSQIVEKISTYSCDEEAVLTAGDGVGVGKVFHYIDGKFDFHQRVYKMSNFKKILGKYFFHYLKENFKKEISKGTAKSTVDSLRLNMIQDFVVTFGNKEEQQQILEFLDVQIKQFDDLISKSQSQINLLQEKRQALITSAVTGKIDVRNGVAT